MLASVEGTCPFTPEQIRRRMDTLQQEMDNLSEQCGLLQSELDAESHREQALKTQHQRLLSWASIFQSATLEEKKVIAAQIIKSVTISRDYRLKIEFNISEAEYLSGLSLSDETCLL